MTAALLEAPARLFAEGRGVKRPAGGGLTLEERLSAAWRGLHAHGVTDCPVCRASMTVIDGSGECGGCGSRLA